MSRIFVMLLSVILMVFTSCNKVNSMNEKKSVNKSSDTTVKKEAHNSVTQANGEKNKNLKDTAMIKGEIILEDGMMKQILSKLDVYMSKLPPQQVELIKSLKIENFRGVSFVINKEKMFVKINGLNALDVINLINKKDNKDTQKYKKYKNIKYFMKDKLMIASDDKNSYIASDKISLENLVNYDMNIDEKLGNIIKESKNNGFYISFVNNNKKLNLTKNMPSFLKSLTGASLFSFTNNGVNKLRLLVKLDTKDAIDASKKLTVMYQVYLPMILKQIDAYEKLFSDKKDLTQGEKDAYKILIKEFKIMAKSVKIEAKESNLFVTINMKSIEMAVTIVGVLAAMVIPSYLSYIQRSKIFMVKDNFTMAQMSIKNEFSKGSAGDEVITNDIVKKLNMGNKKSPFSPKHSAFEKGSKSVSYGSIVISKTNLRSIKTGESVTIYAPNGNKKINFNLKDVTITKE